MKQRVLVSLLCSAIALIGTTGFAVADMIGRYECSLVGPSVPEPIGDRAGHGIQSMQYSCFGIDGLLKGVVMTGSTAVEWDGPKSTFLAAFTTHRTPGGLAVLQLLDGTGTIVMMEGKALGQQASGKAAVKFASGPLAGLSGKTVLWVSKPVGPNRFEQEYSSE
jgi:hypothetical protein